MSQLNQNTAGKLAEPRAMSPMESAMSDLNNLNFQLNDAIGNLHDRLTPVLEEVVAKPSADACGRAPGASPLLEDLYARADQVRALLGRVHFITDQLTI